MNTLPIIKGVGTLIEYAKLMRSVSAKGNVRYPAKFKTMAVEAYYAGRITRYDLQHHLGITAHAFYKWRDIASNATGRFYTKKPTEA